MRHDTYMRGSTDGYAESDEETHDPRTCDRCRLSRLAPLVAALVEAARTHECEGMGHCALRAALKAYEEGK